jgi:hypothetical protein
MSFRGNLPANLWKLVGQHANHKSLRALRGTSTQARRGVANQYRTSAVRTALRSATATTIRPLVAALQGKTGPFRTTVHRGNRRKDRVRTMSDLQIGKYRMTVIVYQTVDRPHATVMWDRDADQPHNTNDDREGGYVTEIVGVINLQTMKVDLPTAAQIKRMGPGAHTVVRLVKAAFREVYGVPA